MKAANATTAAISHGLNSGCQLLDFCSAMFGSSYSTRTVGLTDMPGRNRS